MILHTVVPFEQIFGNTPPDIELTEQDSCMCETVMIDGHRRVSRLISTNPKDFLNPDYSPGAELKVPKTMENTDARQH